MSIWYKLRWTGDGRHTRHITSGRLSEGVLGRTIAHFIALSEIDLMISIKKMQP